MFQKIIKFLILFSLTATFVKETSKYVKGLAFTPHLNIPSITTSEKKKNHSQTWSSNVVYDVNTISPDRT